MRVLLVFVGVSCLAIASCSQSSWDLRVRFTRANGLRPGAGVYSRGVKVGAVRDIGIDRDGVVVSLKLSKGLQVRTEDKIEMAVQGLLGDKVIELKPGPSTAPLVGPERVLRGVDEPILDLTLKALSEIVSAAPEERERIIDKWRPWLELNGVSTGASGNARSRAGSQSDSKQ